MIDLATIRSRVNELVPGLEDVRLELTKDGAGLYFICRVKKMARAVFVEVVTSQPLLWGMTASVERTEAQIASEIAQGLT